jgi:hypothetical protein
MTPQTRPYTPRLYMPGGTGRFRTYPRQTVTPIPGAGYNVHGMRWGEQLLDLDGRSGNYPTGHYHGVPLRGIGNYLGTAAAPAVPFPRPSASGVESFFGVGARLFGSPPATSVTYSPHAVTVQFPENMDPINYDALVSYAKIAVVGVPVALVAGYLIGSMTARRMRANRKRRAR